MSGSRGNGLRSGEKSAKAIVEWIGGKDAGRRTIIDLEWVKNFDVKKWQKTAKENRECEIAEWRVGKKGSWQCYDCHVLEVNDDTAAIKKKLADIGEKRQDGDLESESSEDSEDDGESEALGQAQKRTNKRCADEEALNVLEEENKRLKLALAESVLNGQTELKKPAEEDTEKEAPKVPLCPGSAFTVNATAFNAARTSGNRSTFVGDMLQQLFKKHVLVVSNIMGGKAKGQGDGLHRWALCKKKRTALIEAAMHFFPGTTKSQVHTVITGRIGALRHKLKLKGLIDRFEKAGVEAMKDMAHDGDVVEEEEFS